MRIQTVSISMPLNYEYGAEIIIRLWLQARLTNKKLTATIIWQNNTLQMPCIAEKLIPDTKNVIIEHPDAKLEWTN